MASNNEDKKAPPPARLTQKNKERAREMLRLIEALPECDEKNELMACEQYAEWKYYANECLVKKYTKRITQEERRNGVVIENGVKIKMWKKGTHCFHCNCSAQEFKRHLNSSKHRENLKKPFSEKLCGNIKVAAEMMRNKKKRPYEEIIAGEPADEEQNQAFHEERRLNAQAPTVIATPIATAIIDEAPTVIATPLPHHSEVRPPPPPPPPSYEASHTHTRVKPKKTRKLKITK